MTRIVEKLSSAPVPDGLPPFPREPHAAVAALLTGVPADRAPELPPLGELVAALASLADGSRRKALLALGSSPTEYALVRRGHDVLVSVYGTGGAPEVLVHGRALPLAAALAACRDVATERVAARARVALAALVPDAAPPSTVAVSGGLDDDEIPEGVALAFGFTAEVTPDAEPESAASARADVHAMLVQGRLWAVARGRRFALVQGPVLLAVARMVAAVRALVEAHSAARPVHVRLRSGAFVVGLRLVRGGEVALTLGPSDDRALTVPALDVAGAAMPILRVASELVRAVCTADRAQRRNLRLLALRDEVRALRRTLKARARADGFVNPDAERLRLAAGSTPPDGDDAPHPAASSSSPARLRFLERWTTEIEGLDATSTFLCGDRLVVASQRRVVALARDGGELLWARRAPRAASMMVGTQLARLAPDGTLEVWDVGEGEVVARARLAPRAGGSPTCAWLGGGTLPPAAVVSEGATKLCSVDLRTGEPRWRFAAREGAFRLRRSGRVLLVVSGEAAVHALDVLTGEVLWRYATGARFTLAPLVAKDVAVLVSGDAASGSGVVHGVDLYSGKPLWRRELDAAPLAAPSVSGDLVTLPVHGPHALLAAFEPTTGALRWMAPDPGIGRGGAALAVDRALVVNAPGGRVTALDLESGATIWSELYAKSAHDDVPRRLEPVLRHGALFVPQSAVHVIRPSDGERLGGALECDLIPDVLRVDERGWLYVGEESGHLRAFSPHAQLSLVRGGIA